MQRSAKMIATQPKSTKNLDGYGFPPIEFDRAIAALDLIAAMPPTDAAGRYAGPPPWDLHEVIPTTTYGLATAEPYGATRWRV
jgi:hypothetical protein